MKTQTYNDHKLCKKNVPYVLSNWCSIDSLDGAQFRDGETLDITWADGTTTREKIKVESHREPYGDMGHTYEMDVVKAFVITTVRGAKVPVRIVEAAKRAVRVKA